jgi:hypothetical protein
VVRLPAVVSLVVEQVGEHVVERLRLRRTAGRGVVEGCSKALLAQPVNMIGELLVLHHSRCSEISEVVVQHLVEPRAARALPFQATEP